MTSGGTVLQSGQITPTHLAAWATDGVIEDAGVLLTNLYSSLQSVLTGINFNSGNTDYPIPINLPVGFTRYRVDQVMVSGANASLSSSTIGVFTSPAGSGVAVVAGSTAVTVTQTTTDTVNNLQTFTIANQNLIAFSDTVLYFRVQNPQGSPALANVSIGYRPLP